jgi:hypothetical protein
LKKQLRIPEVGAEFGAVSERRKSQGLRSEFSLD